MKQKITRSNINFRYFLWTLGIIILFGFFVTATGVITDNSLTIPTANFSSIINLFGGANLNNTDLTNVRNITAVNFIGNGVYIENRTPEFVFATDGTGDFNCLDGDCTAEFRTMIDAIPEGSSVTFKPSNTPYNFSGKAYPEQVYGTWGSISINKSITIYAYGATILGTVGRGDTTPVQTDEYIVVFEGTGNTAIDNDGDGDINAKWYGGKFIFAGATTGGGAFWLRNNNDSGTLRVEDVSIDGSMASFGNWCFYIQNASNVYINNFDCQGTTHGITYDGNPTAPYPNNIFITNGYIDNVGRALYPNQDIYFTNNFNVKNVFIGKNIANYDFKEGNTLINSSIQFNSQGVDFKSRNDLRTISNDDLLIYSPMENVTNNLTDTVSINGYVPSTFTALTQDTDCVVGNCFGYTQVSSSKYDTNIYSINTVNPFTMQIWFKTASGFDDSGTDTHYLFSKQSTVYPYQYVAVRQNKLYMKFQNDTQGTAVTSSYTVNDNKWHLASMVMNGTAVMLYLDGTLENTIKNIKPFSATATNQEVMIGASISGSTNFVGSLDEFMMISKALSEKEIKTYYSNPNDFIKKEGFYQPGNTLNSNLPINGNVTITNGYIDLTGGILKNTSLKLPDYDKLLVALDFNNKTVMGLSVNSNNGNSVLDSSRKRNHFNITGAFESYSDSYLNWNHGGVMYFNGSSKLSKNIGKQMYYNTSFTYSFWINMNLSGDSTKRNIFSTSGGTGAFGPYIYTEQSGTSDITMQLHNGSTSYLAGATTANSGLTDNSWHHIVCRYDATAKASAIFVDGVLASSNTALINMSGELQGGPIVNIADTSNDFKGWLDEVRIYDYALSNNEIYYLYESQNDLKDPDLVNGLDDAIPSQDSIWSLGSAFFRWLKGWFVDLDISGVAKINNATITNLNVTTGFTGSCVNITYSQGVAITCNDV